MKKNTVNTGGERGIRTPGPLRVNGFQDRKSTISIQRLAQNFLNLFRNGQKRAIVDCHYRAYRCDQIVTRLAWAVLVMFCAPAHATWFAEYGRADYEKPPCGLWHQECGGYPSEFDLNTQAWRVGHEWGKSWLGVRLSYADLGKYSVKAHATQNEDCANFGGPNAYNYCGGAMEDFHVIGSMRAVGLSVIGRTPTFHGVRLTAEAGILKVRQAFFMRVTDMKGHSDTYSERLYGGGNMYALGMEAKRWSVSVARYESRAGSRFRGGEFPSGVNYAKAVMVGYRF